MEEVATELFCDSLETNETFVDQTASEIEVINDSQVGFHAGKKTYRMLGSKVNVFNGNDRLYPKQQMVDAIERWKKDRKGALGQEPHPESYVMADKSIGWKEITGNNVIKVLDIHLPNEKGEVFFDFQTLDTAKGKDLQATLDAKGKIASSMRATGAGRKVSHSGKTKTVATFIDLYTFDIVPNPALSETHGSVIELTDSQIGELLDSSQDAYSDAIDPYIQKVKGSSKLPELVKIKNEVEQVELDAVDRAAFESAYYRRSYQIRELMDAEAQEKYSRNKIGYVDNQTERDEEKTMEYTFEQLSKMTDAELGRIRTEEPKATAMCDAILAQRKSSTMEDELKVLKDAEVQRKAADGAKAFMDSVEVKEKMEKLPAHVQEVVRNRVDMTNKENAERTFNDAIELANSLVAEDKLKAMGFVRTKPMTDSQARTNVEVIKEAENWREFVDKLNESTNDFHIAMAGFKDENLVKLNKPIVDQLLKKFDKDNAGALAQFADDIGSSTNTSTVLNGVAFHRQILEQAFQTLVALQFVQTDVFSGEFMEIPRETYQRANSRPLRNGEQQPMAKGKLSLDFLHVAAEASKLAAEVTLEAMRRLQTGPLNYDILGRLNYHLAGDLRRDVSLRLHNEQIKSSDEYNAIRITAETPNINGDRTVVTFLRGGTSGSPNTHVPVVRPRKTNYWTQNGKQTVTSNEIIVKLAGNPVSLANAVINYEAGTITFPSALATGAVTVDYSYATNIALFDLTVPDGQDVEKYYNQLIHLLGAQKALMGADPRFYPPNFMLMSETVSNEVSQAEMFAKLFERNGSSLQPDGWLGRIKGIDAHSHNEPWDGKDTRILLGQRMATKYGIGTNMTTKGPFPTRDADGELTGGEELYIFMDDAIISPIKQQFRSVILYRS